MTLPLQILTIFIINQSGKLVRKEIFLNGAYNFNVLVCQFIQCWTNCLSTSMLSTYTNLDLFADSSDLLT